MVLGLGSGNDEAVEFSAMLDRELDAEIMLLNSTPERELDAEIMLLNSTPERELNAIHITEV